MTRAAICPICDQVSTLETDDKMYSIQSIHKGCKHFVDWRVARTTLSVVFSGSQEFKLDKNTTMTVTLTCNTRTRKLK